MKRIRFGDMQCSLARGLDLIGDWWSPLIIRDLYLGVSRFDDLVEDLGLSRNLLASRLKQLTEHGIIVREEYQQHPARYDYRLTAAGRDLVPIIIALTAWGNRWACPKEGPPIAFEHTGCGKDFQPAVVCAGCGEAITAETVRAHAGPGGRAKRGTRLIGRMLAARGPKA